MFGYQFADGFGNTHGGQSSKYGEVIKDVTVVSEENTVNQYIFLSSPPTVLLRERCRMRGACVLTKSNPL